MIATRHWKYLLTNSRRTSLRNELPKPPRRTAEWRRRAKPRLSRIKKRPTSTTVLEWFGLQQLKTRAGLPFLFHEKSSTARTRKLPIDAMVQCRQIIARLDDRGQFPFVASSLGCVLSWCDLFNFTLYISLVLWFKNVTKVIAFQRPVGACKQGGFRRERGPAMGH